MTEQTSPPEPPLVIYLRERRVEREASRRAVRAQQRMAAKLRRAGHEIVGSYVDDEHRPPDYGWQEVRPGLTAALAHAKRETTTRSRCLLAILRVDGIGSGDRFAIEAFWQTAQDRGVQVWGHGDTATNDLVAHEYAHAMDVPVPRVVARRSRRVRSSAAEPEHIMMPGYSPAPIALFVQPSADGRQARVYLCNGTAEPITGRYGELSLGADGSAPTARHHYRPTIDGTQRFDVDVPPGTCQWLFSFARGNWREEIDRYQLELETAGRAMVAELTVEGYRLKQGWRALTWLPE